MSKHLYSKYMSYVRDFLMSLLRWIITKFLLRQYALLHMREACVSRKFIADGGIRRMLSPSKGSSLPPGCGPVALPFSPAIFNQVLINAVTQYVPIVFVKL